MNAKSWLIILILYSLIASAIIILAYFLGHVLLQMPIWFVFILAGLALLAFTIGIGVLLAAYIKRKRND